MLLLKAASRGGNESHERCADELVFLKSAWSLAAPVLGTEGIVSYLWSCVGSFMEMWWPTGGTPNYCPAFPGLNPASR
jgi:hypothetical protein